MDRLIIALAVLLTLTTCGALESEPSSTSMEHNSVAGYVPSSFYDSFENLQAISGGPFKQCSDCNCCQTKDGSKCVTTKCCYEIVCVPPGSGRCGLKPQSCDCNNCN